MYLVHPQNLKFMWQAFLLISIIFLWSSAHHNYEKENMIEHDKKSFKNEIKQYSETSQRYFLYGIICVFIAGCIYSFF